LVAFGGAAWPERQYEAAVVVTILVLVAVRLACAAATTLSFDEALYWLWSRHIAGGYYDHPPINPILIRLGTTAFGNTEFGVRVFGVLLALPASWAIWRSGAILFKDERVGATAALYFNLTLLVAVGSALATPDNAVVAATAFLLLALAKLYDTGRGAWWLAIGVALSLPVLGFGGVMLSRMLRRAHGLVEFGAALLGWIAGGMALTDPLVFPWADVNAPGLVQLAPALGAAFVFLYGRFVAHDAPHQPPKPRRVEKPAQMLEVEAPIPLFESAPDVDAAPEPVDIHEPDPAPAVREDRIAIIGLLLLAIAAGAIIMIASYLDSFN